MKLEDTIEIVRESMLAAGATQEVVNKTIKDLQKAAEDEKAERKANPAKKNKHDFLVLLADSHGKITEPAQAWVFQVEKDCPPMALIDRVKAAAVEFNNSRKGRKRPVLNVAQAIESIPSKYWKMGQGTTRVKTKEPTWAVPTDNKL